MTSTPSTMHPEAPARSGRFHISSDLRLALLFILPAVVLVALLMYYPMIGAVKESLYKTSKTSWLDPILQQIYVGLDHYQKLTSDVVFKQVLKNSLYWTIWRRLLSERDRAGDGAAAGPETARRGR